MPQGETVCCHANKNTNLVKRIQVASMFKRSSTLSWKLYLPPTEVGITGLQFRRIPWSLVSTLLNFHSVENET